MLLKQGYMLISDTASHHPSNQAKLRVGKLLGPYAVIFNCIIFSTYLRCSEKLGDVMFGTRGRVAHRNSSIS